jgi:hypothetical protein
MAKNISNCRKIDQMSIKYTKIFHCKTPPKFTQTAIFWSSGNPDHWNENPAKDLQRDSEDVVAVAVVLPRLL